MATWQEFLSSSPQVCGGEICATGTRIPVTVILDSLAEGATRDEVLASYPSLRVDHIAPESDQSRVCRYTPGSYIVAAYGIAAQSSI